MQNMKQFNRENLWPNLEQFVKKNVRRESTTTTNLHASAF